MTFDNLIDYICGITTVALNDSHNTYTKGIHLFLKEALVRKIEDPTISGVYVILKGHEDKVDGPITLLLDVADPVMDNNFTKISLCSRTGRGPNFNINGRNYKLLDMSLRTDGATTDSKVFGIIERYKHLPSFVLNNS